QTEAACLEDENTVRGHRLLRDRLGGTDRGGQHQTGQHGGGQKPDEHTPILSHVAESSRSLFKIRRPVVPDGFVCRLIRSAVRLPRRPPPGDIAITFPDTPVAGWSRSTPH